MFETLMIAFREGLEAFLIVAIAITYLRKAKYDALIPSVHAAIIVSIVGCTILGVVMAKIGALRPLWEGILALTAAVLVITCTTHMVRMGKHMKNEITSAINQAAEKTGFAAKVGIFSFIVLMIGREGLEAATMIASLAQNNGMEPLAIGGVLGIAIAGGVAWAWTRYGKNINLSRFFQVTAIFMVIFSIQLVIYAFHEFTEASEIASLGLFDSSYWHHATEPWGPQGEIGAWISYSLILVPIGFLIFSTLQDRKKLTPVAN
ncbi:MAG: FTR1 family iron permease [Methylophilaceae bacterium]